MRSWKSKVAVLGLALAGSACGDRPDVYDAPIETQLQAFALVDRVALLDRPANRVALLTPKAGQELDRRFVGVGRSTVRAEASPDQRRLFVLSAGDVPRRKDKNERPSLTVVEGAGARRFELESPHSGFSIDPKGRYVALFAAPAAGTVQTAFVENPNEIVIVDLEAPADAAVTPRTLRSFGGRPQRVSFTDPLSLPGGQRRLLVVETDQDVHLLDLDNIRATPRRPEITMRLTSGATAASVKPAAIVVDDGDPARNDDARIGVRAANDSSVFMFTLVPAPATQVAEEPGTVLNDFFPEPNQTDVGGIPSDIQFVRTDGGLRLAAVVPTARKAVLVDPTTSITIDVQLTEPYSRMSLITSVVGGAAGADTALLYGSGGSRGVAFWSLGKTLDKNYRTVEVVSLASSIERVRDVPPPRPELKVLEGQGSGGFFVLNLASRTAAPLTTLAQPTIHVAPDGQRLWAYQRGSLQLAQVTLENLHPIPLPLDRPIDSVFDVVRADGGRSLVALDARGGVGATVLDALAPDTTASRSYYGILLEGL
ncbi:MAG: hypothetical protein BGO98_47570 [Myxococcales bacterium 68-20]|nr:MAG: hypothetical protein BGO98_47570 [Myxococcales bacterium 68-20]